MLPKGRGPHCGAVFSFVNSPVRALQFTNSGAKLAVGFECGHVRIILALVYFTLSVLAIISQDLFSIQVNF